MSRETAGWLNSNVLVGFTDKRGKAWHYRADLQTVDPITGHVGNHYSGPIPVEHVEKRLFNFDVESASVYTLTENPSYDPDAPTSLDNNPDRYIPTEGRQAIRRTDNMEVLGIFTDGYQIHNFRQWLLDNVANLLDDDLSIGSSGLLAGGARAWVSVEMPDNVSTPEGVEFRPNLLATTSYDGHIATTYKRCITLVVCDNTLDAARGEQGQTIKLRHSKNSLSRIGDVRDALNIINTDAEDFAAEVKRLCETTVTDKQWSEFLSAHIPLPEKPGRGLTIAQNKREAWAELWNKDDRVTPWKGTAFGVLQAGNTWDTHLRVVRGRPRPEANMTRTLNGQAGKYDADVMADLAKVLSV